MSAETGWRIGPGAAGAGWSEQPVTVRAATTVEAINLWSVMDVSSRRASRMVPSLAWLRRAGGGVCSAKGARTGFADGLISVIRRLTARTGEGWAMIRFHSLGTLDLRDSQGRALSAVLRRPKLIALLGYLAAARPFGFHRRDSLLALLWPELDNAHARNALRQALHTLREALGYEVVLARGEEELEVSEESIWSDVRSFAAALELGQAERALELYRGELLAGLHVSDAPEFERWLDQERDVVRRRACEAARLLCDRQVAAGNPAAAARWARRLTEVSPFDETAVRRLIDGLDRMGD